MTKKLLLSIAAALLLMAGLPAKQASACDSNSTMMGSPLLDLAKLDQNPRAGEISPCAQIASLMRMLGHVSQYGDGDQGAMVVYMLDGAEPTLAFPDWTIAIKVVFDGGMSSTWTQQPAWPHGLQEASLPGIMEHVSIISDQPSDWASYTMATLMQ